MPRNSNRQRAAKGERPMPNPQTRINKEGKVTSYWVWTPTFSRDGKADRERVAGKTVEELKANYNQWFIDNPDPSLAPEGHATIEGFGKWWIPEVIETAVSVGELSPATLVNYQGAFVNHICNDKYGCGFLRLNGGRADQKCNHENLMAWVRRMQKAGVPLPTMVTAVKVMRAMGKAMPLHASKSGVRINPAKYLEYPSGDAQHDVEEQQEYETDPQVSVALLGASNQLPAHLSALWKTCTGLGIRRGELCGLQWGDFDFEGGWVTIQRQVIEVGGKVYVKRVKNDKRRGARSQKATPKVVPLDPSLADALLRQRAAQQLLSRDRSWGKPDPKAPGRVPGEWVFSEDGLCLRPMRMQRLFVQARSLAGEVASHMTLHKGRHDFISYMVSLGLPPDQVSAYARHKDPQTIFRAGYIHKTRRPDEGREKIGQMFAMLDQLATTPEAQAV